MNPIEQLKEYLPELTKSEKKIASYIIDNPSSMIASTVAKLAEETGTSNTAVIRLCQKLGYNGFSEFRFDMSRALISRGADDLEGSTDPVSQLVSTYASYMSLIPRYVSEEEFLRLASAIREAKHLVIWGINRTFQSASQLSNRLSRLGYLNKVTDDYVVMTDDSALLREGDVCILFSLNGRGNPAYATDMDEVRSHGATLHLVTMNPKLELRDHASYSYLLPWISKDNTSNFYEDQIVVYMFIEILLYYLTRDDS